MCCTRFTRGGLGWGKDLRYTSNKVSGRKYLVKQKLRKPYLVGNAHPTESLHFSVRVGGLCITSSGFNR
jgi:hypothetical protein